MNRLSIFFLFLSLLWLGCEEIPPEINPAMGGNDSGVPVTIEEQQRQVLIEEFTGVKCVNCPAGAAAIESLLGIHGPQLVAISIHAGSFSSPYQESLYDFRVSEGLNLLELLGAPLGYPTAVVNRRDFGVGFGLQQGRGDWAESIQKELALPPRVKIGINSEYAEESRELTVAVSLYIQETIEEEDVRLSIAITEDGVMDLQLTPDDQKPDPNYIHKHTLRDMMTAFAGNLIQEPLTEGAVITKTFSLELSEAWVAENCKVAAFVHFGGENLEVLQAHEVKVVGE